MPGSLLNTFTQILILTFTTFLQDEPLSSLGVLDEETDSEKLSKWWCLGVNLA